MATLDLRAPSIVIKFDKGKTLKPIFYYVSPENTVIDLTGYTARMQVRISLADPLPVWDLTTENGGLSLVTGTALIPGSAPVVGAHGIQTNITEEQTEAATWDRAIFDIELIAPSGDVLPFLKGTLVATSEVTR